MNFNDDFNLITEEEIYDSISEYNKSESSLNCSFSILHVNIRSINKNINSLELYLNLLNNKPDVIVCSEAWLRSCNGFVNIDQYNYYSNDSKINKSDGVVVFVKENLTHSFYVEQFRNLKVASVEVILPNIKKVKISGFYRCFDYDESEFIVDMHKFLNSNKNINNHFIAGDSNINTLNSDTEYLDNFLENSYCR